MLATYTIIISMSLIIIASFLSYWFQSYFFDQKKEQFLDKSYMIQGIAMKYMERDGDATSQQVNDIITIISKYIKSDIWLTDSMGYVYAVSNKDHKEFMGKQVFGEELDKLRQGHTFEITGPYAGAFDKTVRVYGTPIINESGSFKGSIILYNSIDEISSPLKRVYEIIWISAIFAIIFSCIVIYYFSQKIIIKPLAEINSVARKISNGDVNKRVYLKSNDEIGELAQTFNFMADSVEKNEKNRREFISNVSHEIRSPITSIKGFIGGILDGVIPEEKEKYYLSIAYEEIQRLTRLVNDLLDMSAIEAGEFSLKIIKVDINEIIRLTVIKNETKIKEKRACVDVCFEEDNLFVAGDQDRLVQVITNLLDNSIKYVNEGGKIKISSKTKGRKAFISVFNDGPQIAEEDLLHIWDRFYKADKARTVKDSTGLGLAIVRNIITQLQEDIWVENKDKGVYFTFTLMKVE
ncbi:sensor histidine kinase [Clostridium estertheticum]|uniref:histidine kinase n=1 Tax=Clostridium estertheticum subsp. estertheticum TaxID=1552 RepID=A0A1J0GN57_9CLOT|nr:HAMP domain-containing sensor histidine kinase [Clostridium estertheticum]APC42804.1 two-component sensor histidine kinase [Clostridium estertheticum subsp. estertheticum]MBU3075311.1 HAMP domain-containing histidine kinase [Clostridium estertheticum]MBU3164918.1 HAMP domain-containing histidine kinase [Clostridium estertheticum]MBU3173953.1 HAMP domain-containing histidine kinase [Clostridium estertheticum]MBZ9615664.1 HAMP domain-containing histidine kinase [Clostridium estertheticum subs